MIIAAFLLGLMGSLHCIGMCGPLAIMACSSESTSVQKSNLLYNVGRISTYTLLGGLIGIIGTFLFVSKTQQWIAIILGIILIFIFLFQINIDQALGRSNLFKGYKIKIDQLFSLYFRTRKEYNPFILGMLNGLLPCGLVYLALVGALNSSHWTTGMLFMFVFGLSTLPSMMGVVTGFNWMPKRFQFKFKQYIPIVSLVFGCFLIYRGIMIEAPMELDFWEAMKNPILCH